MQTRKTVYSSHVSAVGYDSDTGELSVEWDTGKVSVYAGVPAEVAEIDAMPLAASGKIDKQRLRTRLA